MAIAADASSPTEERASLRTWLAVFGCMLGALMSVLDIQVTNASLPEIEGGISTGVSNGAWISTAYLIGEIIMIPLADYFSRVFSFRRFLLTSVVMFLTFSVACAFATSLEQMILLRGLQGFACGGMIPLAMTYVLSELPRKQQPMGIAIFALTATFGPAIGPTLGGYLTTHFDWRYVFFVNLIPGSIMMALLIPTLKTAPMQLKLLREGDWWGIAFMIVGLACLQTVLDEGNQNNWFSSPYIVRLSVIAFVCLSIFIAIELMIEKPLLQLRLFTYRNFSLGTLANVIVGLAMFGSIYVLPTYLDEVQKYNALEVGTIMAWSGIPQLFIIPFIPMLQKRFDARLIIGTGMMLFAYSCFMNSYLSMNYGGQQFIPSSIVRAFGQAIMMAPLALIAFIGVPQALSGQASGLFNMTRSLGGAFGTAILATLITKREQFHSNMIGNSTTTTNPTAQSFLTDMQQYFIDRGTTDSDQAMKQAEVMLGQIGQQQALIMSYSDAFFVMGCIMIVAIIFVAATKSPKVG